MLYNEKLPFSFHIELTDKCNARCPQCSRNVIDKGVLQERPDLAFIELSLNDYKSIFKDLKYNAKNFTFCGNFGDPVFAKDFYEIIQYTIEDVIRPVGTGLVNIHTNGGFRSPKWWAKLGKMMSAYDNHLITFSIDGLEDTHHLYRVNTRYHRVVENARAFINAGGNAEWSFIRFGHNEHQEKEARRLASEYGFKNFIPIDTQRFWTSDKVDFKFNTKEFTITRSSSAASDMKKKQSANYKNNIIEIKQQKDDIDCQVSKKNEMYIDCAGDIHPCCWLGSHAYREKHYTTKWADKDHEDLHPMFDMRTVRNAIAENLNDIIHDDFFKYILPMSFEVSPCGMCVRQCSKNNSVRTTKIREAV
tara:strand:+ start:437 stop:1519 length:1083 start_codon:yes stop_codon:yes gene_type:complete